MPGEYLLDTSVIIPLFRGEPIVQERLGQADRVFLSVVVLGELHFGAEGSARAEEQLDQIQAFAACTQLACDAETARHYGRIKQNLRRRGRPIPENDLWIAATAVQHELVLVTRDEHFHEVEALTTERWWGPRSLPSPVLPSPAAKGRSPRARRSLHRSSSSCRPPAPPPPPGPQDRDWAIFWPSSR